MTSPSARLISQTTLFMMGLWSPGALIAPGLVIALGFRYLRRMR